MGMLGLIIVGNNFHNMEKVKKIQLSRVATSVLKRLIRIAQSKRDTGTYKNGVKVK
jgi:hypothetical protein